MTNLETTTPVNAKRIEGKFPRTDMIWPDKEPVLELGFNPDYMMKLCQQFKKMDISYVHLKLHGSQSAMELTGESMETGQKVRALLMPMQK